MSVSLLSDLPGGFGGMVSRRRSRISELRREPEAGRVETGPIVPILWSGPLGADMGGLNI